MERPDSNEARSNIDETMRLIKGRMTDFSAQASEDQQALTEVLTDVTRLAGEYLGGRALDGFEVEVRLNKTSDTTHFEEEFAHEDAAEDPVVAENTSGADFSSVDIEDLLGDKEEAIQLPSLFDQISRFTSSHEHKYNPVTVYDRLQDLDDRPSEELSEEDLQLISDIEYLEGFSYSKVYKYVYTPKEINILCNDLRRIREEGARSRPDFGGLEGDILAVLRGSREHYFKNNLSLQGNLERAERDAPGRRGMQWSTLRDRARQASESMRVSSLEKSEETKEYIIPLRDPDAIGSEHDRDLSRLYQFVTDWFAHNVIISRKLNAKQKNLAAFEGNAEIINDYVEDNGDLIDSLPDDFRITIKVGRARQERKVKPADHLRYLVQRMNDKLNNDDVTSGLGASYKHNTDGALRLQYVIAHFIDDINKALVDEAGDTVTVIEDELQ